MSKNKKREKSLLNKFKEYTDEMILAALKVKIPENEILIKSEIVAIELLAQHGITVYPTSLNQLKKQQTERLIEVAKLRNIVIPSVFYSVKISSKDVIARIEEFKYDAISWVEEHNYLYDLIDPYDEISPTDNYSSEETIEKIYNTYNEIISSYKFRHDKIWNPDLWKPLGIKPIEIKDIIEPAKSTGGFLPYQDPNDRYEVRGIMPSSKNSDIWEDIVERNRKK